ncbi:MAG: hypothetical protein PHF51_02410 [Candidatus ainarchaeum sp.]|nr:hypothetical protein [Candidatus ainarchaeum sp.]
MKAKKQAPGKKAVHFPAFIAEKVAREIERADGEVFSGSPLKDRGIEGTVLRCLAVRALRSGSRVEEVRVAPEDLRVADGWKVYVESYSSLTGNKGIADHLLVDERGALFASPALSGFIKGKIVEFAGLHKL